MLKASEIELNVDGKEHTNSTIFEKYMTKLTYCGSQPSFQFSRNLI